MVTTDDSPFTPATSRRLVLMFGPGWELHLAVDPAWVSQQVEEAVNRLVEALESITDRPDTDNGVPLVPIAPDHRRWIAAGSIDTVMVLNPIRCVVGSTVGLVAPHAETLWMTVRSIIIPPEEDEIHFLVVGPPVPKAA